MRRALELQSCDRVGREPSLLYQHATKANIILSICTLRIFFLYIRTWICVGEATCIFSVLAQAASGQSFLFFFFVFICVTFKNDLATDVSSFFVLLIH